MHCIRIQWLMGLDTTLSTGVWREAGQVAGWVQCSAGIQRKAAAGYCRPAFLLWVQAVSSGEDSSQQGERCLREWYQKMICPMPQCRYCLKFLHALTLLYIVLFPNMSELQLYDTGCRRGALSQCWSRATERNCRNVFDPGTVYHH